MVSCRFGTAGRHIRPSNQYQCIMFVLGNLFLQPSFPSSLSLCVVITCLPFLNHHRDMHGGAGWRYRDPLFPWHRVSKDLVGWLSLWMIIVSNTSISISSFVGTQWKSGGCIHSNIIKASSLPLSSLCVCLLCSIRTIRTSSMHRPITACFVDRGDKVLVGHGQHAV
jgi:hypothetical protein